jgi:hypothetical protein
MNHASAFIKCRHVHSFKVSGCPPLRVEQIHVNNDVHASVNRLAGIGMCYLLVSCQAAQISAQ